MFSGLNYLNYYFNCHFSAKGFTICLLNTEGSIFTSKAKLTKYSPRLVLQQHSEREGVRLELRLPHVVLGS